MSEIDCLLGQLADEQQRLDDLFVGFAPAPAPLRELVPIPEDAWDGIYRKLCDVATAQALVTAAIADALWRRKTDSTK